MSLHADGFAKEVTVRTISREKLRRDAKEAVRIVNRPWYETPTVYLPRQYARLHPSDIEAARTIGVAELAKRSKLPRQTIMEILAP